MDIQLPCFKERLSHFKNPVIRATVCHETLYTAHENGMFQVQSCKENALPKIFKGHKAQLSVYERSLDNCFLVSAALDGSLKLWNITGGQTPVVQQTKKLGGAVRAGRFSHSSKLLAIGCDDKSGRLFSIGDGRNIATFTGHTNWVTAVDVNEINLLTGGADKNLLFWDIESTRALWSSKDHLAMLRSVRFSDAHTFTSAANDGMIKIYDARTQHPVCNMKAHEGTVSDLDIHDSLLLSCGSDSKIKLFDLRFTDKRAVVDSCGKAATTARFYNSGLNFVTTHEDCSVGLWNTTSVKGNQMKSSSIVKERSESEIHNALDCIIKQLSGVTDAVKLMTERIQSNEAQIAHLMQLVRADIDH